MAFETIVELNNKVVSNGNVIMLQLKDLKKIAGCERFSFNIVKKLSNELVEHDLMHYPFVLPTHEKEWVAIYKVNQPTKDIINTIHNQTRKYEK
jgi:hypothetical protein